MVRVRFSIGLGSGSGSGLRLDLGLVVPRPSCRWWRRGCGTAVSQRSGPGRSAATPARLCTCPWR
eukprot:scaffold25762_cov48-Phaeocystis_antarctica.AAC.2